jgi:hypothetical protein
MNTKTKIKSTTRPVFAFLMMLCLSLMTCGKNVPEVAITSPADGASVAGFVNIVIDATDAEGVLSVQVVIDDTIVCADTDTPYVYTWNTTNLVDNSSHVIFAIASDFDGNETGSDKIHVTIGNIQLPFTDDFESYDQFEYPSSGGWWPIRDASVGSGTFVDSGNAYQGHNIFRLEGGFFEPRVDGVFLDLSTVDKLTYEYAVFMPYMGSSGGSLVGFYVQPDSYSCYIYNAVCFSRADHIVYVAGETAVATGYSWTEDTWYKVRVDIDYDQLLLNAWIDTVQIMNNLNAASKNTSKNFVLCTELNTDCVAVYDDISISRTQ